MLEAINIPTTLEIEKINEISDREKIEELKNRFLGRCVQRIRDNPNNKAWVMFGVPNNKPVLDYVSDKLEAAGWVTEITDHTCPTKLGHNGTTNTTTKFKSFKITRPEKTSAKRKKN